VSPSVQRQFQNKRKVKKAGKEPRNPRGDAFVSQLVLLHTATLLDSCIRISLKLTWLISSVSLILGGRDLE
jgi:hypothetical protein